MAFMWHFLLEHETHTVKQSNIVTYEEQIEM